VRSLAALRRNYRLVMWPIMIAAIVGAAFGTLVSMAPALALFLAVFVALPATLGLCILAIRWFFRGRVRADGHLGLPVAIALRLSVGSFVLGQATLIGDYAHLAIMYPVYMSKIEGERTSRFRWPGFGLVGTAQVDRTLIYDPNDELASVSGKKQLEGTGPHADFRLVAPLFGHFYLESFYSNQG
jgi:hypothetical protein